MEGCLHIYWAGSLLLNFCHGKSLQVCTRQWFSKSRPRPTANSSIAWGRVRNMHPQVLLRHTEAEIAHNPPSRWWISHKFDIHNSHPSAARENTKKHSPVTCSNSWRTALSEETACLWRTVLNHYGRIHQWTIFKQDAIWLPRVPPSSEVRFKQRSKLHRSYKIHCFKNHHFQTFVQEA